MGICLQCCKQTTRPSYTYCSNKCQADRAYNEYILRWHDGSVDGARGKMTRGVSLHVRRYLFEKYSASCSICGWHAINPTTGRIPLEIDHIDAKAENNSEGNLRLLCPNCHSLTPGFRSLNRGSGRKWRRDKYIKRI